MVLEGREARARASVLAVIGVGVLYLALAVATLGNGAYGSALANGTPLVFLARDAFGPNGSQLVGIAGFLLCLIPVNADVAGTSRLVQALGERGLRDRARRSPIRSDRAGSASGTGLAVHPSEVTAASRAQASRATDVAEPNDRGRGLRDRARRSPRR